MKRLLTLAALLLVALAVLPALAQDEPTIPVDLNNDYTLQVPDGWESRDGLNGGVIISDETRFLYVMDPDTVAENVETEEVPLLADILIQLFELQYRTQLTPDDVTPMPLGDLNAVVYEYPVGDVYAGTFLVVEVAEGSYALFDLTTPVDDDADAIEFLTPIVASLISADAPVVVAATVVPCMVTAAAANSVAVRVGPGDNRAILFYMPDATEVRANGQYVDDEGDLWLRLIKAQLAPDSSADELWVALADVEAVGGCDTMTMVSARGIIPAAPPIVAITDTSSSDPSAPTAAGDPNAVVGLVPRGGVWRLSFDTTALQSCANGETTQTPTADVLGDFGNGYSSGISPAADGRSFTFYGITYVLQDGGIYIGGSDFGDGVSQTTRLRPISDSQMTGEFTINVIGADYRCSITIFVSVRRGG